MPTARTTTASDPTAPGVQWVFYDFATRPTLDVTFPDDVPPGKTVWIVAQWLSPRLQRGPMSPPKSANLPGGGVSRIGTMKAAA